ncbi:MAG: thioredoxin family protein [Anaerolineaceae bacterium]|nr:thioredoxin family protein [Anaerolineaceae bacterium]
MITEEVWNRGLSLQEYIGRMEILQKEMQQRVNDLRITSAEFQKLKEFNQDRKILVVTEAWCKDCLMNLPIIAKMVEASPNVELKIFIRHENPELTLFFSQNGYNNIPLCWVMKKDFSFCGAWVERPQKAHFMLEKWKNDHPEYVEIQNDNTLSDEHKKLKIKPLSDLLLDEMWNWYDTELQSDTSREIQKILNC